MSAEQARSLIQATGARATLSRLAVLEVLLRCERPLSHQEILQAIEPELDRVTVYRVLDWLTDSGLAHRINAADRATRFSVSSALHCHVHFQCERCGHIFCLPQSTPVLSAPLPAGFVQNEIEVTIRGICASCVV